jgi:hypothetical protein
MDMRAVPEAIGKHATAILDRPKPRGAMNAGTTTDPTRC